MRLDLSRQLDVDRAKSYLDKMIKNESKIIFKRILEKRTINQNAYLHVCIGIFCNETGYSMEEAKTVLKREFGRFMVYEKNGVKFLLSTSVLDKLEMTEFIEWIRNVACYENLGVYVPTPEEYLECQYDVDKSLEHLF